MSRSGRQGLLGRLSSWTAGRSAKGRAQKRRLVEPLEARTLLTAVTYGEQVVVSGFNRPFGVAADPSGDVFFSAFNGGTVNEVRTNGTIKIIGNGLVQPAGVAVDSLGDVFVAEYGAGLVREIPASGPISTIGSSFGSPAGVAVDAAGDVFVASIASSTIEEVLHNGTTKTIGSDFDKPNGVSVDAGGDVFVADTFNNAVEEVPAGGGAIKTLGSGFSFPNAVAVDGNGDVFVADTGNNAIKEVLTDGTVKTIASGLNQPTGIALGKYGDVFVADSNNGRIVELSRVAQVNTGPANSIVSSGATLTGTVNAVGSTIGVHFQFSTDPSFTPTVQSTIGSGFVNPAGVAVDAAGDVFVADSANNTVTEVPPSGAIKTIGSGFNVPTGVAVDAAGNVFVADYGDNAVKEVLPGGAIQTIGSGFNHPTEVALDAAGDVFVADSGNNAVKEVLSSGTIMTLGSAFNDPTGVAVDAFGNVFVADSGNNAVKKFQPGGAIQTIGSGFNSPRRVALDAAGDVFVTDTNNNAVKEILPDGAVQTIGSAFSIPKGVAVDAAGDVFVADSGNVRIVELSPSSVVATPATVSGTTSTTVSATLSGLTPGTTYYDRIFATSAAGIVADLQQPPQSFATAPKLAIGGSAVTYDTEGPATVVAPHATLTTGDASLADAKLSVTNPSAGANDRLGVRTAGKLTVTGATITYNGVAMGTFTGGGATSALIVSFNASATQSGILAVVQNVTFQNTTLTPGNVNDRSITFQLAASEGNATAATQTVHVKTPPLLSIGGPAVTYHTGGSPVPIAPAATLSAGDGLFANSKLSVTDTNAGANDRLGIHASGALTISSGTLSFSGTAIGTFSGGAGMSPLIVTFNAHATEAAILSVIRNITFTNTVSNPGNASNRLIDFQLTDGGGNKGVVAKQTVVFSTAAAKDALFARLAS